MAINEETLIVVLLVFLGFVSFNVDPSLANAFWILLATAIIIKIFDKNISFPLERPGNNRLQSLLIAIGAYFGFLLITSLLLSITKILPGSTINSVAQLYSETQPILKGSLLLTIISFGLVIPIIETYNFFVRLFEWVLDKAKTTKSLTDYRTWAVIILIAAGFVFYHLQAKLGAGAAGFNQSLFLVFMFAITSMVLVIIRRQGFEAILVHIIANSVAITTAFKVFTNFITVLLFVSAFIALFFIATRRTKSISLV